MTRRRALALLYGSAGVLSAPWVLEWVIVRLKRKVHA